MAGCSKTLNGKQQRVARHVPSQLDASLAVSAASCSNSNKTPSAMLRKPVYAAQGSPAPYL
jgi:hypothetical protein